MQQYVIFNVLKEYCIPKEEEEEDKLFTGNVKYLLLFHHFKAIYQFPKPIIFWVKIVANASLRLLLERLFLIPFFFAELFDF